MKNKILRLIFLLHLCCSVVKGQDTFSILAFDSVTREVGAAGASCLDLSAFPSLSNDFICELFPDTGAIACQAAYNPLNQQGARSRMRFGDSATAIIQWLENNDAGSNGSIRQYGAIRMDHALVKVAAFTGTNCMNYKNHITGRNYTIHGNILLGQQVLDSMEAKFKRAEGDLACKLMAAMQGANIPGADTRCMGNGTSSLFAFLKVMQPTDTFGKPSFLISLRTPGNAGIEPIDSLQRMFDAARTCTVNTTGMNKLKIVPGLSIYPVPAGQTLIMTEGSGEEASFKIRDVKGKMVYSGSFKSITTLAVRDIGKGIYFVEAVVGSNTERRKIVVD